MLETIKHALRISHSMLDDDINATIKEARAELVRSGVDELVADGSDPLIIAAIKTYCLWKYTDNEKKYEQYQNSFLMQQDNLRRSGTYNGGDADVQ